MPIPIKKDIVYEQVPIEDFVTGIITEVGYEKEQEFKSKFGNSVQEGVYLKFKIDGLKFPKRTRWMKLNYSKKSNLFKKYISSLVDGAKEYMNYDVDRLLGLQVKMLWKNEEADNGKIYQSIDVIRPVGKKLPLLEGAMSKEEKDAIIEQLDALIEDTATDFDPDKIEGGVE